jgi:hypothetical protein
MNCSQYGKALRSFKQTDQWHMIFVAAKMLQYTSEEICRLGYEIAESMQSLSKHTDAAHIYLNVCNDTEQAVLSLITGYRWQEALHLVILFV